MFFSSGQVWTTARWPLRHSRKDLLERVRSDAHQWSPVCLGEYRQHLETDPILNHQFPSRSSPADSWQHDQWRRSISGLRVSRLLRFFMRHQPVVFVLCRTTVGRVWGRMRLVESCQQLHPLRSGTCQVSEANWNRSIGERNIRNLTVISWKAIHLRAKILLQKQFRWTNTEVVSVGRIDTVRG